VTSHPDTEFNVRARTVLEVARRELLLREPVCRVAHTILIVLSLQFSIFDVLMSGIAQVVSAKIKFIVTYMRSSIVSAGT